MFIGLGLGLGMQRRTGGGTPTPTPTPPANITIPTITGTPATGSTIAETMTFGNGTWTNSPTGYVQTLHLDGVLVLPTYTWQETDNGKNLVLTVVASNADGDSDPADSDPFAVVLETSAPATAEANLDYYYGQDTTLWLADFRDGRGRVLTTAGEYDATTILTALSITKNAGGASVITKNAEGEIVTFTDTQPIMVPGLGLQLWPATRNLFVNSEEPVTQSITLEKVGTTSGAYTLAVFAADLSDLGTATVTASSGSTVAGLLPAAPNNAADQYNWITVSCTTLGSVDVTITQPISAAYLLGNAETSDGWRPVNDTIRVVPAGATAATRNAEKLTVHLPTVGGAAYDPVVNGATYVGCFKKSGATNYNQFMLDLGPTSSSSKMRIRWDFDPTNGWRFRIARDSTFIISSGFMPISTGQSPEIYWAVTVGPNGIKASVRVRRSDSQLYDQYNSSYTGMSDGTAWAVSASDLAYMRLGGGLASGTGANYGGNGSYGWTRYVYVLPYEVDGTTLDTMAFTELDEQDVFPMELGINAAFISQDMTSDDFNDRGMRQQIQVSKDNGSTWATLNPLGYGSLASEDGAGNSVQVSQDGVIGPANGWGATHIRFNPPVYWCAGGTGVCFLPAGLSGSDVVRSGGGTSAYDPVTGRATFTITEGDDNNISVTLPWSAFVGASGRRWPSWGLIRTGNEDVDELGSGHAFKLTPEAKANYQALGGTTGVRWMEAQGINNTDDQFDTGYTGPANEPPERTVRWSGWSVRWGSGGTLAEEFIVSAANDAQQGAHYCASVYDSDSRIETAGSILAYLSSGLALRAELHNELWNDTISLATWTATVNGVRRGYTPVWVTTHAMAASQAVEVWDYLRKVNRGNNRLLEECVAGRIIAVHYDSTWGTLGSGNVILECIQDAPVDTEVHNTDYFTPLFGAEDTRRAMRRYKMRRSKEFWAILDAQLLAAGRPRSIHVIADGANAQTADYKTMLDFDNGYLEVDEFMIGGYGSSLGPFGNFSGYPTGWKTEADQTLMYHDLATAVDNYAAAVGPSISNIIANSTATGKFEVTKKWLGSYCASKGIGANAIKLGMYEGGQCHWVSRDYPDMCPPYSAGTTFGLKDFCYEAGAGTFRSLVSGNVGNTPSTSPGQWELYQDAQQAAAGLGETWDNAFSIAQRTASPRMCRNFLQTFRAAASYGAQVAAALDTWQTNIGGPMYIYCRMSRRDDDAITVNATINEMQGWGVQFTENETTGGSYLAMAAKQSELVA